MVTVRIAIAVLALASASARADTCSTEDVALHDHLASAARDAGRWNLGWQLGFGVATIGQLGLALAHDNPLGPFDRDYEETLYVGAAKAALATASRLVMPLRAAVPPCSDRVALRAALEHLGRQERQLFWMTHVGSILVNLAGAVVLAERRSWSVGAVSFALGYPVGLLSIYTMPRASWHLWRDATFTAVPTTGGVALGVAGRF